MNGVYKMLIGVRDSCPLLNQIMKNFITIFVVIFVVSCARNYQEIADITTEIGARQGLTKKIYHSKNFEVFTLQKITNPKKNLRIYFEGDGRAFIDRNTISSNPTPTSFFLINLIAVDDSPNIIYIARPCQFVEDKKCEEKYWSNARFSQEILYAIDEVVKNFPQFKLELVGYSGGGEVAKYIAAKNKNVVNIRTIAGNIDHKKFTEFHKVSALDESLGDEKLLFILENIPQIHFVGVDDEVVPAIIAQSYLRKLSKKSCVKIIEVKDANHQEGWQLKWGELLGIAPSCVDFASFG
jgi:hypothetical protein